ncbi:hypothetical protein AALH30_24860 [Blautia pseudococcoides]|uniref:hypothetical protein n=1 Tax=Blautia pseudococcoides TaxID=1796616 RepID=UPI0025912D89|nr:hypothetical protein [uncultured Blautia sp.]
MKKKIILLLSAIMLLTSGCGDSDDFKNYKDDLGNSVIETDKDKTTYFKELPSEMQFNDNTIQYVSLDLYQDKSASGHGYNAYATLTIDVANLNDDELYWIEQASDNNSLLKVLDVNVYITDEKNGLDFDSMLLVSGVIDGSQRTYCFALPKEYKNSFDNSEISGYVNIEQDETYEFKSSSGLTSDEKRIYKYSYNIDCSESYKLLPVSQMSSDIYNSMVNGMQNIMK